MYMALAVALGRLGVVLHPLGLRIVVVGGRCIACLPPVCLPGLHSVCVPANTLALLLLMCVVLCATGLVLLVVCGMVDVTKPDAYIVGQAGYQWGVALCLYTRRA